MLWKVNILKFGILLTPAEITVVNVCHSGWPTPLKSNNVPPHCHLVLYLFSMDVHSDKNDAGTMAVLLPNWNCINCNEVVNQINSYLWKLLGAFAIINWMQLALMVGQMHASWVKATCKAVHNCHGKVSGKRFYFKDWTDFVANLTWKKNPHLNKAASPYSWKKIMSATATTIAEVIEKNCCQEGNQQEEADNHDNSTYCNNEGGEAAMVSGNVGMPNGAKQ